MSIVEPLLAPATLQEIPHSVVIRMNKSRMLAMPTRLRDSSERMSTFFNSSAKSQCSEWWKLTQPSKTSKSTAMYSTSPKRMSWYAGFENLFLSSLSFAKVRTESMSPTTIEMAFMNCNGVAQLKASPYTLMTRDRESMTLKTLIQASVSYST